MTAVNEFLGGVNIAAIGLGKPATAKNSQKFLEVLGQVASGISFNSSNLDAVQGSKTRPVVRVEFRCVVADLFDPGALADFELERTLSHIIIET